MTPVQASKKANKNLVFDKLRDDGEIQTPKYKIGHPARTADIKRVFSKGDSTNWRYNLHIISEVIHDTFPSYRINNLPQKI